jgi:hypothetical protein
MPLPVCQVQCYVYSPIDGLPEVGATITAKLNQYEVYQGHIVVAETSAVTDADGLAVLPLWPNELGSTESAYKVKIQPVGKNSLTVYAVVPLAVSANLFEIATLPVYDGKPDGQLGVELANVAIAAANAAAGSAATSATTASQQAVISTTKAVEASEFAGEASTFAGSASTSAGNAATQVGLATTQAGIATAQAVISTDKAAEAAASAATFNSALYVQKANIVGTVSESGGVPTGAIVERGSNANGKFVKFADGTMICWHSQTVTDQAISTAYGSLYRGSRTWSFPAVFIASPVVTLGAVKWGTAANWGSPTTEANTTSAGLQFWDVNSRASGTDFHWSAQAIGRWF